MTNWKTVKITNITKAYEYFMTLGLDDNVLVGIGVSWEREKELGYDNCFPSTVITVENCPLFNTWQIGDYIEVDQDKTVYRTYEVPINDTSIVRKVSSSSSTNVITTRGSSDIVVSPSAVNYMKSQEARELAREMSRMVDDTGKEVEYKIQVENKGGKKISHSLILRKI